MNGSTLLSALTGNNAIKRVVNIALLLLVVLFVQAVYATYVRPAADRWTAEQQEKVNADPAYLPGRSLLVIIREPEPESAIIMAIWSILLASLQGYAVRRQRSLLDADLMQLPAGSCILPDDVRDQLRRFDQLPGEVRESVVPRVLRSALKRFGATANVQDAATTVHQVCEIEGARLESELAMVRFGVWSIPAIGFVGTVRGLGEALQSAQFALNSSNPSGVTSGLGVSFNSTFVALTLCILVMYVIHELQLAQERLVLDVQEYAEENLISNLRSSLPDAPEKASIAATISGDRVTRHR